MFDVLIFIASASDKSEYNQWNTLCLEIFYLIFRGVESPSQLVIRSDKVEKEIREERLGRLLKEEASRKRLDGKKGVTRHSRFGTTVVIETGKDRIVMHKQAAVAVAAVNPGKIMDEGRKSRASRNKRANNDLAPAAAEMTTQAIKSLQLVAQSFLESAFNSMFLPFLLLPARV